MRIIGTVAVGFVAVIVALFGLRLALAYLHGDVTTNITVGAASKWLVVRKDVPASIGVYEPTWLPSRVRHPQPDGYMVSGGGTTWDYAVWYTKDRLWGDRVSLNVGEGPLTCPSPSCLKDGLGVQQPLPIPRRQLLLHETLYLRPHAPEIVLTWMLHGHEYEIEAHSLSVSDVLRVAASLQGVPRR